MLHMNKRRETHKCVLGWILQNEDIWNTSNNIQADSLEQIVEEKKNKCETIRNQFFFF